MLPLDTQGDESRKLGTSIGRGTLTVSAQSYRNGSNGSQDNGDVVTLTKASSGQSERPAKKAKRGKYISRACPSCQQRKIKCEGGKPCRHCLTKHLPCMPSRLREGAQQARRASSPFPGSQVNCGVSLSASSVDKSIDHHVLTRLDALERRLLIMRQFDYDPGQLLPNHSSANEHLNSLSANLQNTLETEGQTFAGEKSMNSAFDDENQESISTAPPVKCAVDSSLGDSLQFPKILPNDTGDRIARGWFENILVQHGVTIDEQQARYYLKVYMDDVHPLYPIIHPPTVWMTFNLMWQQFTPSSSNSSLERDQVRISVALVCFCLALGRCSVSSSLNDPSGIQSSGWIFYNIGMSLIHDILDTSNTSSKSLVTLQVLTLRVIYLLRLDAIQQAARVHALTISIAYSIGIHRQSTLDGFPFFYTIESGKPYLIQDSNVDAELPVDISDEWMTRFTASNKTMAELQHEIASEIARIGSPSPIPFVTIMVQYSRVAGKTWEALYGVQAPNTSKSVMVEYVDTVVDKIVQNAPKSFVYHATTPYNDQPKKAPCWQVKQAWILSTCFTYLRFLIRRPFLHSSNTLIHAQASDLQSSRECASLGARILTTYQNIKDDTIKFGFGLTHYVTSCTMVMVGLVSREAGLNRRYGPVVLASSQFLELYCRTMWVSRKMKFCVSRLQKLVQRTLAIDPYDSRGQQSQSSEGQDPDTKDPSLDFSMQGSEHYWVQSGIGNWTKNANDIDNLPIVDGRERKGEGSEVYVYNIYNDTSIPETDGLAEGTEVSNQLVTPRMDGPRAESSNSWVTSDFNFDLFGTDLESTGAELSRLPEIEKGDVNRPLISTVDWDVGEEMFWF